MKILYLFSGLGADKRVFDFLDLTGYSVHFIEWIPPIKSESIELYASRILPQIKTSKPILIGVSFGGIMAMEIGKLIETDKIILISSARTKRNIPLYYKITGILAFHKVIPATFLRTVNKITYWFFGVANENEKKLLKTIIEETDISFLRWAIEKIVKWKNVTQLTNVTSIHGTHDRLLTNTKAEHTINQGGHLMIINKSREVNEILRKILTE
jgi:esterase/lipase